MKIIAFYGPQGAGKSEASKITVGLNGFPECVKYKRESFAGPLYEMMSSVLAVDARTLDKSEPRDELCGKSLRQALQSLGTEWGRGMIGEDIWLNSMFSRIKWQNDGETKVIVIDDLRFRNEYEFLRSLPSRLPEVEVVIVKVCREGKMAACLNSHASEVDWVDFTPDRVIDNNGDLAYLKQQVIAIITS